MCVCVYGIYLIHYTQNERILKGKQMTTMEHVISADACVCNAISGDLPIYARNTYRYNRPLHKYKLYLVITYTCPKYTYNYSIYYYVHIFIRRYLYIGTNIYSDV